MTPHRPQRLFHLSPPGSLLKSVSGSRENPRKDASEYVDAAYLGRIRELPCLKCGMEPSEAAHVRMASAAHGKASGMQKKPADRWALPLCAGCHRDEKHAQHNQGEANFWCAIDISPLNVCEALWAKRDDPVAMRAVIFSTIAQRGK
jgi:hypothetical protein